MEYWIAIIAGLLNKAFLTNREGAKDTKEEKRREKRYICKWLVKS